MKTEDVAFCLFTCDKEPYVALWNEWLENHKQFWKPEMPEYFINEKMTFIYSAWCSDYNPKHGFRQIKTYTPDWTESVRIALNRIPELYIYYTQEDYLLFEPMTKNYFTECVRQFEEYNMDCLQISRAKPKHAVKYFKEGLNHCIPETKYYLNLQTGIWRKQFFLDCLRDGETPWQFERNGNDRKGRVFQKTLHYYSGVLKQGEDIRDANNKRDSGKVQE